MAPPSLSLATDNHLQPQLNGYTASIDTKHNTSRFEMGEMSFCRFDEESRIGAGEDPEAEETYLLKLPVQVKLPETRMNYSRLATVAITLEQCDMTTFDSEPTRP